MKPKRWMLYTLININMPGMKNKPAVVLIKSTILFLYCKTLLVKLCLSEPGIIIKHKFI
jgi:hypothetical protein